jgi:hypothetical protein
MDPDCGEDKFAYHLRVIIIMIGTLD